MTSDCERIRTTTRGTGSSSRLLRRAPARYARSFLYTEQDQGDLTYFLLEQARVVVRAVNELDTYLARKTAELRSADVLLRGLGLNYRQTDVLGRFLRDPGCQPASRTTRRATASWHRRPGPT